VDEEVKVVVLSDGRVPLPPPLGFYTSKYSLEQSLA
jgi:hypothetical protein